MEFRYCDEDDEVQPTQTIYLISDKDVVLKGRIEGRTEQLAKNAYRTLHGVNVPIPPEHREALSMRQDQTTYHYEPRKEESINTLWLVLDDFHKLYCMSHHVHNMTVRRELQDDIHTMVIGILRLLHWS